MPFFTHNVEVMLNDELKPISPNCYAYRPISLHQLLGEVPSFGSCVESVLAIGHLQLQKGVLSIGIDRSAA